jgi:hypothetical protein
MRDAAHRVISDESKPAGAAKGVSAIRANDCISPFTSPGCGTCGRKRKESVLATSWCEDAQYATVIYASVLSTVSLGIIIQSAFTRVKQSGLTTSCCMLCQRRHL